MEFHLNANSDYINSFSIFESLPIGICIISKEYDVIFWNYCMEYWTSISRDKILGQKITQFFRDFDEKRYRLRLNNVFDGGPPIFLSSYLNQNLFQDINNKDNSRFLQITINSFSLKKDNNSYALLKLSGVFTLPFLKIHPF